MTTVIQFAILGLGIGAAYTLLAQGLLLVYRGSGVLNFSHAAMAMAGAYAFWQLRVDNGQSFAVALIAALLVTGVLGLLIYFLVMRPLARASSLARIIATLGLLTLMQGIANLIWGPLPKEVDSDLPTNLISLAGVHVGADRLILFGIALVLTLVLWYWSRSTTLGLAIRASAQNPRAAATLGWSPQLLGAVTWGIGGVLAGAAGVFIAPLAGIDTDSMPMLIIPVFAAALVGRLGSFWWTLVGAMIIGIAQSEAARYVDNIQGFSDALPFIIILILLIVRNQGIGSRTTESERQPPLGTGRIRLSLLVPAVVIAIVLVLEVFSANLDIALGVSFAWAIVLLSVVLLLGYTGQLSLAQFALGGIAALFAGRLVADAHLPFIAAFVVAIVGTAIVGVVFALPALRARGINLAVVTVGLAVAVAGLVFTNATLTGGINGTPVGAQRLFGINLDTIAYPQRWTVLVIVVFALCGIVVANLRRGATGRRLIAVRTNERAASALGISVLHVKLYAFAVAAAVAAVGGIMLGFRNPTVLYSDFDPIQSILAVGYSFVGGVGYVPGAAVGGTLATGGFGSWILNEIFPNADPAWLSLIGGGCMVLFALMNPDGIVAAQLAQFARLRRRLHLPSWRIGRRAADAPLSDVGARRVTPAVLEVADIVVRFGGVTAVDGATLRVEPGRVVGLIGPNGAGKTTLIDAITGFVPPAQGHVRLSSDDITRWPVYRRARAGLSRSFQSLELFESSTVRENLSVASDPGALASYVTDAAYPRRGRLSGMAAVAVREFRIDDCLDTTVSDLSYGRRRLVAIARAIATEPSVLLLDEPAAGLSSGETRELATIVRHLADEFGFGVLVVEHDMAFVMSICDKVVVLDFGRQIATGTPSEVSSDPAVIAAYLGDGIDAPVPSPGTRRLTQPDASVAGAVTEDPR
jgi:sulfate-transporting ATPase